MLRKIDFAKELNKEQLSVVREGEGPCLVLAGAGSGKTRTIIYRVAYLIEQGVDPESILLLTFTNKAAGEMTARLRQLVGPGVSGLWSGTFHSVANRLLRRHAELIGHTSSFSILDQEDSKRLVKACIREIGLDKPKNGRRFPSPGIVQDVLSYGRNAGTTLADSLNRKYPNLLPLADDFSRIGEIYDRKKREADALDFDDLLSKMLELLDKDPQVRQRLQRRFRHILVDEYQDTNFVQSAIVSRLAGEGETDESPNVLAVGDDAQSIYSFRAADIRNILEFPNHFEGTRMFKMTTNYRSSPQILELANEVIANNVNQFRKELVSVRPEGEKPRVLSLPSASQEAKHVADRIEDLISDEGVPASEIAVLFRATFHSQMLEFELMRRGIEYDYRGGMKFFERAHVKDTLAFLRVRANLVDEAAWLRVLTLQDGIGDVSAGRIAKAVQTGGGDLKEIAGLDMGEMFGKRVAAGWSALRRTLEAVHAVGEGPSAQIRAVLKSPYVEYMESEYPNFRDRLEDLEQMAVFAERYDQVQEFLAEVALDDSAYFGKEGRPNQGSRRPKPVLSTVHQAKGLEWDTVFVIHLTATGFPNRTALMEEKGLEEERRLFYVAVTRAKRQLFLSHPAVVGRDYSYEGPSRFLEEIDPRQVEAVRLGGFGDSGGGYGKGGRDDDDGRDAPSTPFDWSGYKKAPSGKRRLPGPTDDFSQPEPDHESDSEADPDRVIELDENGEPLNHPMAAIRERVKKLKREQMKKKSFLRDC